MNRQDFQLGMVVEFGRENGERTRGTLIKLNPTKAKVQTLESRGTGRGSNAGTIWSVPYSMMQPCGDNVPKVEEPKVEYSPFMDSADVAIMEAICTVYTQLSPENLTCDGELPPHIIHTRRGNLTNKLHYLFKSLGRTVSESSAYNWLDQKREADKKELVDN